MEFKGTKGPWDWVKLSHGTFVMAQGYCVAKCNDFSGNNISDANALLISKAPEMLEMLNHVLALAQCGNIVEAYKIEEIIKSATQTQ